MGCGASTAATASVPAAGGDEVEQRSPGSVDRKVLRAETTEFSGWQDDTFSPAVAAVKAARNPNDISAPQDAVPAAPAS